MKKSVQGWTLVEVIVTMAVSSLFFALASTVVISLVTNYKSAERQNHTNREVALLSDIISDTIQSYNVAGDGLMIDGIILIATDLEVISFDESGMLIYQKKDMTNNQHIEFKYISSIEFIIGNDSLLEIVITNKDNRINRLAIAVVGGVSQRRISY